MPMTAANSSTLGPLLVCRIRHRGQVYEADLARPIDLAIVLRHGEANPRAFGIPHPRFETYEAGGFVGSVEEGGPCNVDVLVVNVHGNGTHTEGIGHISREALSVHGCLRRFHFVAKVITVDPVIAPDGDLVIRGFQLRDHLLDGPEAVIIRTLPNGTEKLSKDHSGTNPCYLTEDAAALLASSGVQHILVDLPSIDREDDAGRLAAHRAFWRYPESPRRHCTVTEMVFVPNDVPDGSYLLNLQVLAIESDAVPSRPILFPLVATS